MKRCKKCDSDTSNNSCYWREKYSRFEDLDLDKLIKDKKIKKKGEKTIDVQ